MNVICLKYRLYPTKAQQTKLLATLDLCRQIYNSLLLERKATYETAGESITYRQQQNVSLKNWKAKCHELTTIHSQVLQNVAIRIDLAFQSFFRRVKTGENPGYPRFKGQGQYDSITFPQFGNGVKLQSGFLSASKIGEIACVVHRPLLGTPKTCTIRRQAGKWFACIVCEYESEPLPQESQTTGIDVGLEKFAALSNGEFVDNPRFFRQEEKALAKAQRKLSRQPKGSYARKKARKVVSRIHERIRNRRHNFVHQLARKLVNQFGLIAVEKLNVKGMVQNHCLAKSISDAAWSQFRSVLSQKAESAARKIVEVNPAFTSQICSRCGNVARKPLKERWHFCPICSLSLDRDTNAAHNILQAALQTALGLQSVVAMAA